MGKSLSKNEVEELASKILNRDGVANLTESSLKRLFAEIRRQKPNLEMTVYEEKLHKSLIRQIELSK